MPRSLAVAGEEIREITLHAFGDASGQGLAAGVYAVVQQHSVVTQGLVTAKARLAKEGLVAILSLLVKIISDSLQETNMLFVDRSVK